MVIQIETKCTLCDFITNKGHVCLECENMLCKSCYKKQRLEGIQRDKCPYCKAEKKWVKRLKFLHVNFKFSNNMEIERTSFTIERLEKNCLTLEDFRLDFGEELYMKMKNGMVTEDFEIQRELINLGNIVGKAKEELDCSISYVSENEMDKRELELRSREFYLESGINKYREDKRKLKEAHKKFLRAKNKYIFKKSNGTYLDNLTNFSFSRPTFHLDEDLTLSDDEGNNNF